MKRIVGYAVAFIAGCMMTGGVVWADTAVQALAGQSSVALNGSVLSNPPKLVYQGTTYMPIWYVMQALKKVGIVTSWDGRTLSLDTSGLTSGSTGSSSNVITFSNITVKTDALGMTEVDGIATNNDTVTHSFFVTVSFFDSSGKLLGTATGAVDQLAPGDSKTFQAMATEDFSGAASYKVQVDALS